MINSDRFYSKLHYIIDTKVPDSVDNNNSSYLAWFSFDLIKSIIIKKKLHKIWISSNLMDDYIEFKKQRAICLRRSRLDQRKYFDSIQTKAPNNIKEFWRNVNKLSKKTLIPEFVHYKGFTFASRTDTCNLFATFFKSTYSSARPDFIMEDQMELNIEEFDFKIASSEIIYALSKLSESVLQRTDNVPEVLVK